MGARSHLALLAACRTCIEIDSLRVASDGSQGPHCRHGQFAARQLAKHESSRLAAPTVTSSTSNLLEACEPLILDMARDLPASDRWRRLLAAVHKLFECDASALLRLEGDVLVPIAVDGLAEDTLGRRFRVSQHPRLEAMLAKSAPTLFDAASTLPDPYDGLVDGVVADLTVHDCMGCPLSVDGRTWGLLTMDALEAGRFARIAPHDLQTFVGIAAAAVSAADRITRLDEALADQKARAEGFRLASATGGDARPLVGSSPAFKRLLAEIQVVSDSSLTVLIKGETGTGKELVAQALHAGSPRSERAMIVINCAALPESLIESELFGHVRGAFSGATVDRKGKFELAHQGTLFLDEVGELSLPAQAKLLRVMQTGQLQRVGSDKEHHVDVRVIAASNRDLAEEVRAGRVRADFYHRLSVYPLALPPLRERGRDVLLLAGSFLEVNRGRLGLQGLRLTGEAQAALLTHAWPGNVRELEHLIARSALKAIAREPRRTRLLAITLQDLGLEDGSPTTVPEPGRDTEPAPFLRTAVAELEGRLIRQSLHRHAGNWTAAARDLGLDRANLKRMATRLGVAA
jgi:anaerobic nitric oxide reductase transcription regulator